MTVQEMTTMIMDIIESELELYNSEYDALQEKIEQAFANYEHKRERA